jgi:hypothetical protein
MSLETPTYKSWLNVLAKNRDVVTYHFAPEWTGRPLYLMIPGGVSAVVAGVWIFFLAKSVWVLLPERLLHGKQAPPAVSSTDRSPLTTREALSSPSFLCQFSLREFTSPVHKKSSLGSCSEQYRSGPGDNRFGASFARDSPMKISKHASKPKAEAPHRRLPIGQCVSFSSPRRVQEIQSEAFS